MSFVGRLAATPGETLAQQEQAAAGESDWKRLGLWLVLLLGVGLLALMAVSLLRRPSAE